MHHHCLLNTYSLKLLSGEKGKLLIHRSRKLYVKKQVGGKNRIKKKEEGENLWVFFKTDTLKKEEEQAKEKNLEKNWRKKRKEQLPSVKETKQKNKKERLQLQYLQMCLLSPTKKPISSEQIMSVMALKTSPILATSPMTSALEVGSFYLPCDCRKIMHAAGRKGFGFERLFFQCAGLEFR